MSHQALSELHIIPQGQTVNSLYYRDEILAKTCRDAINRTENMGLISEPPMLGNMSDFIFMQDGAPAHTAKMTQKWCRDSLNGFGRKISIRSVRANLSSKYTDAPSTSTVYRATRACGFNFKQPVMGPFITPLIAKNRVEWCKDHVNYCWENVFFTDECSIWLNRGSVGMWTRAKENPILKVQRHTPKLHVWGGISSMGTTILKIFTSNFVSKLYIDTLNECLIRTADVY
ncbi:hypothetical protein LOD99_1446 [Oopsacas minuta]|uniref:Transposase n=1 Tax=Oopsacas minuta TaxID=111878 RepID=A0AAV7K4E0_9METZ|nr:hypothetical protein LOD99_1446 [Oopsacas minuta]